MCNTLLFQPVLTSFLILYNLYTLFSIQVRFGFLNISKISFLFFDLSLFLSYIITSVFFCASKITQLCFFTEFRFFIIVNIFEQKKKKKGKTKKILPYLYFFFFFLLNIKLCTCHFFSYLFFLLWLSFVYFKQF